MSMLTNSASALEQMGKELMDRLNSQVIDALGLELISAAVETGSGSLPTEELSSKAVILTTKTWSPDKIMQFMRLRKSSPVVGYIHENQCYFNLRTVLAHQIPQLAEAFRDLTAAMEV